MSKRVVAVESEDVGVAILPPGPYLHFDVEMDPLQEEGGMLYNALECCAHVPVGIYLAILCDNVTQTHNVTHTQRLPLSIYGVSYDQVQRAVSLLAQIALTHSLMYGRNQR
jgi:hypothetical protein